MRLVTVMLEKRPYGVPESVPCSECGVWWRQIQWFASVVSDVYLGIIHPCEACDAPEGRCAVGMTRHGRKWAQQVLADSIMLTDWHESERAKTSRPEGAGAPGSEGPENL